MDRFARQLVPGFKLSLATVILMAADMCAITGTIVVSLMLHFDTMSLARVWELHLAPHRFSLPMVLAAYLIALYLFRLYRYAWRFASLEALWGIVCANTTGLIAMIVLQALIDDRTFPLAVLFVIWLTSIFLVGGVRILLRLVNISRHQGLDALGGLRADQRPTRAVILGGGPDGARLLSVLREDTEEPYDVIGFLDDTPQREGLYIRDVRILGPLSLLDKLLAERAVDEVFVSLPAAGEQNYRECVMTCRRQQVPVKVIPGVSDALQGKTHPRLEEISVEDLLRRPPVHIDPSMLGSYLTGKRVLVTGAGGSIGSELCRQILKMAPAELVLLGHGENSIHLIHNQLTHAYPDFADRLHMTIGSVSDDVRIDQIFRAHRPEVVFHAAAHKHVPIMETNVTEAVQNNVLGTQCVAEACGRGKVERMVLISTDKAVNPASVMGATKWLCEEVVRGMASGYPATQYVTVRFGNVLGSRGSVARLFSEQIKRGGPVTVTHPEVTRYFMTIPEAVQLVLQAGAIGESGELFLLNMGKPVKIVDLARDMIRLSGYEPDTEIRITFTGLRPGEKLNEMLAASDAIIEPASCDGLSIVHRRHYFAPAEIRSAVRRLQQLASSDETEHLLDYLGELIPSFASQRLLAETLPETEYAR